MMRVKQNPKTQMNGASVGGGEAEQRPLDWELRPGGMLVQRRAVESEKESASAPTIRVRVKYGSSYHEIRISSQATFGELKKMLVGSTGLHHQDQKIMFKDKERDSRSFLDISGVKDKSKLVLVEDPISQEKRFVEMRKNAKMEKASKSISEISLEVDRLAGQVSALESIIGKGGNVAEKNVLNLIELLMNQLLKLDGIMGDGDVKLQRKMQVRRVQKYVETLDLLKLKTSKSAINGSQAPIQAPQKNSNENGGGLSNGNGLSPFEHLSKPSPTSPVSENQPPARHSASHSLANHQPLENQHPARHSVGHMPSENPSPARNSSSSGTVVTTKWETFDAIPASSSTGNSNVQPRFDWEFFD